MPEVNPPVRPMPKALVSGRQTLKVDSVKKGTKAPNTCQCIGFNIDIDLRLNTKIPMPHNEAFCLPPKRKVRARPSKTYYQLGIYSENQLGQKPVVNILSCWRKNCKVFHTAKDKHFRFALLCGSVASFSKRTIISLNRIWDVKLVQGYSQYLKRINHFIFSCFTKGEIALASKLLRRAKSQATKRAGNLRT